MLKNQEIIRLNRVVLVPIIAFMFCVNFVNAQSTVIDVDAFNKVVVSPHITVVFVEGDTESVTIESTTTSQENINIEVKKGTLNLYLDGAKAVTETRKIKKNGNNRRVPIYRGTVVKAIITYKSLKKLDLRGEERFAFESPINTDELRFSIYGASQVFVDEVSVDNLYVTMYGESYFEILKGDTRNQKLTAYGETTVNVSGVKNEITKLTSYGDGSFQLDVSEKLKITAYGEATVAYSGNPVVNKGIIIGETKITRINF